LKVYEKNDIDNLENIFENMKVDTQMHWSQKYLEAFESVHEASQLLKTNRKKITFEQLYRFRK
jgi:hypothetical protein